MPDNNEQAKRLEQTIYDTIALGKAMKLRVSELTANTISIEAPVANANFNIHGTAFAGSIYSICALAAWGLVHTRVQSEDISAEVVLARAEIEYLLPIDENIRATGSINEDDYREFHKRLLQKGKASISLSVSAQEGDEVQARLDARVAVKIISL